MSLLTKYKPYYTENLKLAIPVVISQLGHVLVQTSDSIIIGHFAGTISLAAVSLVGSIFVIALMIGIGISYGITPLIAQQNGSGHYAECGRLLSNSLLINVVTAIVLFVFIWFGSGYLLGHLDQSPEVVAKAKPFMLQMGISLIPLLVFSTFKQFAEGLGFTKQAMRISIWGNIINICIGITLVKGLFGITPMGIKGVGYSTLIDRTLMATVMAIYVFRSHHFKKYLRVFAIKNIDWKRCKQILTIGAPVAMQYTFEIGAFSSAGIIIGTISPAAQAAHLVALSLASMTYMMASGVSSAAAIRAGNNFGAKNFPDLRMSAIASYHIVLIFMSLTAIIFTFANHLLPWIYSNDIKVIAVAAPLIIIAAVFQLFDGAQVVGLGVLRGMGDVNIPTVITFVAYWVVGLPLGAWLGLHFGLGANGVWYGLTAGLAVAAIFLFLRFQLISKRHSGEIG